MIRAAAYIALGRVRGARSASLAARIAERLPGDVGVLEHGGGGPRPRASVSDIGVVPLGPAGGPAEAIVKIGFGPSAERSLARHRASIDAVSAEPGLGEWRVLLPQAIGHGTIAGRPYLVERRLPGLDAAALPAGSAGRAHALEAAAGAARTLHERTGAVVVAGDDALGRWVDAPVAVVRDAVGPAPGLARAADELRAALRGRRLAASWTHGDLWLGNVLVEADGTRATGLVDWEAAEPAAPPGVDAAHLLLTTRAIDRGEKFGAVVRAALARADWSDDERRILDGGAAPAGAEPLDARSAVTLAWLRHVAGNLLKSRRYAYSGRWLRADVHGVLAEWQP